MENKKISSFEDLRVHRMAREFGRKVERSEDRGWRIEATALNLKQADGWRIEDGGIFVRLHFSI
jgi:hypothetical protein